MQPVFSEEMLQVMKRLGPTAAKLGHDSVDAEHILISLLHDEAGRVASLVEELNCDVAQVRASIAESLPGKSSSVEAGVNLPLTKRAEAALKNAYLEAMGDVSEADLMHLLRDSTAPELRIGTRALLLGLLRDADDRLSRLLENEFGITHTRVRDSSPDSSK